MQSIALPDWLDRLEVARALGINPWSVPRLQRGGHLRGVLVRGKWLFARAEIERFAASYDRRPGPGKWGQEGTQRAEAPAVYLAAARERKDG